MKGHRPIIPDETTKKFADYSFLIALMVKCWDKDGLKRPSFVDVVLTFQENEIFNLNFN